MLLFLVNPGEVDCCSGGLEYCLAVSLSSRCFPLQVPHCASWPRRSPYWIFRMRWAVAGCQPAASSVYGVCYCCDLL